MALGPHRRARIEWLPPPVDLATAVRTWRTHGGRAEAYWLWGALVAFALEVDSNPQREEILERLFATARRLAPLLGDDDGGHEVASNLLNVLDGG